MFEIGLSYPKFYCYNSALEPPILEECSGNLFCKNYPDNTNDNIDWHYNSWTKQFNLICDREHIYNEWLGFVVYVSGLLIFIVLTLGDRFGRIPTTICFVVTMTVVCFPMIWIDTLWTKQLATGIYKAVPPVLFYQMGFIINESCLSNSYFRTSAISVMFSFKALGGILTILLAFLANDSDIFFGTIVILSILTLLPVPFYVWEGPKNLYQRGQISKLFEALTGISKINQKNKQIIDIQNYVNLDMELDISNNRYEIRKKSKIRHSLARILESQRLLFCTPENLYMLFCYTVLLSGTYIIDD